MIHHYRKPQPVYDYKTEWRFQEDFGLGELTSGRIGVMGWNSAGTLSAPVGETDHPGILRVSTGGTINTTARINMLSGQPIDVTPLNSLKWIVRPNHNDTDTLLRFGFSNAWATSPADHGTYFEKLEADTNWFCVCRSSSVQTRVDSGVAVGTGWVTLETRRTSAGVLFYINGVLVATIATNILSIAVGVGMHIINAVASAKTVDLDYIEGRVFGLARV